MNKQYVAGTLAVFSLAGLLAMMLLMMFQVIPSQNLDMVKMSMVGLFGLCTTAFGYYLGSSQGSRLKTEMAAAERAEPPKE